MRFLRVIRRFENWPLHYLNRWGLLREPTVELRTRDGVRLKVRTGTSDFRTSRSVLVDQKYFHGAPPLGPESVVVDAGAHIGSFAVLAGALAPRGRVLAFEPEPANFAMLQQNIALNGMSHVTAFNRAVGGTAGPRELHLSLKATTTGGHSLVRGGERSVTVECTTLDRIVEGQRLDRIDFLKLDCEGAELEFLQAASPASLALLKGGSMEIHSAEAGAGAAAILEKAGLRVTPGPASNYLAFRRG